MIKLDNLSEQQLKEIVYEANKKIRTIREKEEAKYQRKE